MLELREKLENKAGVQIEFGDGWLLIFAKLLNNLSKDAKVLQAKQKFGIGRIYLANATDEDYTLVGDFEKESGETCEICGQPGKLIGYSYYRTVCPEHEKLN